MHAFLSEATKQNLLKFAAATAVVIFGAIFFLGTGYTWYGFGISDRNTSLWIMTFIVIGAFALVWVGPRMAKIPQRVFWSGVIGFFLISKIAWLLLIPTQLTSDFANYDAAARAVANGLGINPVTNNGLNGWGYPFFLGSLYKIFGQSINTGKIANLILDLIALGLLYRVSMLASGQQVGRWTIFLYAIWPVQIAYTSVLGTEHLSLVLTLIGVLCALLALRRQNSIRNFVLSGLFFGVGFITRPAILAFVGATVLVVFFMSISIKRAIFLAGSVLFGFIFIYGIYSLGLHFFNQGYSPDPRWSYGASLVFGTNLQSGGAWNEEDQKLLGSWPKDRLLANALELAKQRIINYSPYQVAKLVFLKSNFFWNAVYYGVHWSANFTKGPDPVILSEFKPLYNLQFYFQGLIIFLGMIGCIIAFRNPTPSSILFLLALLFGTLIHILTVTDSRYQYSFEPLLMVMAGLAISINSKPAQQNALSDLNRFETSI